MGSLIRMFLGGFARLVSSRAGQWVVSILGTLGLAFASYTIAIEPLTDKIVASMQGMPADAAAWMGWAWIDRGVSLIVSAMLVSAGIGAAKRMFLVKKAVA